MLILLEKGVCSVHSLTFETMIMNCRERRVKEILDMISGNPLTCVPDGKILPETQRVKPFTVAIFFNIIDTGSFYSMNSLLTLALLIQLGFILSIAWFILFDECGISFHGYFNVICLNNIEHVCSFSL